MNSNKSWLCSIIALKASGRDCTNNNELLHEIGVLQRYAMQLFVFTRELFNKRFDGAESITVVLKGFENKVEGSSPNKTFFYFLFFAFAKKQEFFRDLHVCRKKACFDVLCTCKAT